MLHVLEQALWAGPLPILLLGTHLLFTLRLGVQRYVFRGIRLSLQRGTGGGISSFGALTTALAATLGTGNIVGIASAVLLGGPGAVFWCWLSGLLGMATRYAETYLSVASQKALPGGGHTGGPMYVMADRLHMPRMAVCFSVAGALAAVTGGALLQSHAISGVLRDSFGVPVWLTAAGLLLLAGPVICGGAASIAKVSEKLVPAMAIGYLLACGGVLFLNRAVLWKSVQSICLFACSTRAAAGGFVGNSLASACRYGVCRGLFSNEAGMGTAPMAAAAAEGRDPTREALISMTGVFWSTTVVCAATGLVVVSSVLTQGRAPAHAEALAAAAFSPLPGGPFLLAAALSVFAFTTVIGWCCYGETCAAYVLPGRSRWWYRSLYLLALFLGAFGASETVWSTGSLLFGLMAIPNLISLLLLRKEVPYPTAPATGTPARPRRKMGRLSR